MPSIVEIKDYLFAEPDGAGRRHAGRPRAPGRPLPASAVGYATKSKRGVPAEDGAVRRHRRRRRRRGGARRLAKWCASPTPASARASSPSAPKRARNSGSTASAPRRSAKHTNAFKINEDVVIPLPRMGEYTDGIERINIELSLAQQAALVDELRGASSRAAICRWARATTRSEIPAAELLEDRVAAGARRCMRDGRARQWQRAGWQADGAATPSASTSACAQPDARSSTCCRTTPCAPRGRAQIRAPLRRSSPAPRFKPILDECSAIHKRGAARPRLGGAAHACRRRQRAHQHPGQQRQLRDAADRARGGGAHHGAGALASTA